jgi:hypothetical protein
MSRLVVSLTLFVAALLTLAGVVAGYRLAGIGGFVVAGLAVARLRAMRGGRS